MLYDLSNELSLAQCQARFNHLVEIGSIVDLTEKVQRTGKQNRYLHVIIGLVALEVGETLEYVKKNYYKIKCNSELFLVKKHDEILDADVTMIKSSKDLTKEEMTLSIDRFRNWASTQGWYLPSPEESRLVQLAEIEVERNRRFIE